MIRRVFVVAVGLALVSVGVAGAQHPLLDMIASKVIQKYQQATCEQLWQQKAEPKPAREQEFVQMLRNDPQMRTAFIDKVAAPMANKMFECGLIP